MTIKREIYDPSTLQASVEAHVLSNKNAVGVYESDFAIFFDFAEDGKKISRVVEYMDSAYVQAFEAKVSQVLASHEEHK
jgi:hypothetical protein